jgi:hypothetical protein
MMMFKDVYNEILRVCRASNDDVFKATVKNLINIKYFELCREFSVRDLRAKLTLDFTTSTSSGLWLPSNIFGVDSVRDEDGVEFFERDRSDIEEDEFGYRYYRYKGSDSPLVEGEDLAIISGTASFTSATLDAYISGGGTVVNQYIRFGEEHGFYKITSDTSPYTISTTYHGDSLTEDDFRIRPEEDERMILIDNSESVLLDRSIDLYYWKAPSPLYRDSDFILLPTAVPLILLVLRELPEAKALRPVSQNEIDEEKAKMYKLNPTFAKKSNPRDKHNNIFDMVASRNFFTTRS